MSLVISRRSLWGRQFCLRTRFIVSSRLEGGPSADATGRLRTERDGTGLDTTQEN